MKSKTAKQILKKYKKLVWPQIKKYLTNPKFPKQFKVKKDFAHIEKFHWELISEYPQSKGKYLRPTLLILTTQAMGKNPSDAIKTAAAMQISEEWILNHDDVEDDSILRRGKPTLHKLYNKELAINAGDALHAIMWKVLSDNLSVLGKEKTSKILDEFYKIILRTTLGQTADIKLFSGRKFHLKNKDWFFIADSKSAYYTIAAPIRLGAIIADATENQLDRLAEFGLNLGRSFQLVDDILDVTSDFSGKKQLGNDIYEGKRTLILAHLLRNAKKTDRKKLFKIIKKERQKTRKKDVRWVINKMHEYKSIDYARQKAEKFKERAEEIFKKDLKFLYKEPYRAHLKEIMSFILERDH